MGAEIFKDVSIRNSDKCFLSAEGCFIALNSLDNVVNSFKVLPNKMVRLGIVVATGWVLLATFL